MSEIGLSFIFYSFIGWMVESVFRSVVEKGRLVNSGFLFGPFIPVYGFGGLIFEGLGSFVSGIPLYEQIALFTVFATVLEYITSVLLEKIFDMKLWDYSSFPIHETRHINFPLNINGRVCLLFSFFWAVLILFQIVYLHPFVSSVIEVIPVNLRYVLIYIFLVYLGIDLYFSARLYYRFSRFLLSVRQLQVGRMTEELQSRLRILSSTRNMNMFLRPLRVFPFLRDQLSSAWQKIPFGSPVPYLKEIRVLIAEKLPLLRSKTRTENLKEFYNMANPVIDNPEYQKLKKIKHHDKDIYTHNLSVAWISFLLAKRFGLRIGDVVRGALLHDFFFYDWRTFRDKDYILPHGFSHPVISYKNAVKVFGRLTPVEKDIIVKHMWPLTVVPPRYRESLLVTMVDKAVASREAFKAVMPKRKETKQK